MSNNVTLYREGGPYKVDAGYVDYIVVDKDDTLAYEAALAEGWYETPEAAIEAAKHTAKATDDPLAHKDEEPFPHETSDSNDKAPGEDRDDNGDKDDKKHGKKKSGW